MKDFTMLIIAMLIMSGAGATVVCGVLVLYLIAAYIHSKHFIIDLIKWIY
jgi:hypothetical protein